MGKPLARLNKSSLMAEWVKNLPVMQETQERWVRSLGQEDPLEKEIAAHSSILSCLRSPMDRGTLWATVHWVTKCWTQLSD